VGHGTGAPSVIPGIVGLPNNAGTPPIFTIADAFTAGVGMTVLVVHGLLAGLGGTGHVVGLAEMSVTRSAGAPPTITWNCLGVITTGPMWQQVMTALALTRGGTGFPCAEGPRSIATVQSNGNHPQG
jgi:hypothetical protein